MTWIGAIPRFLIKTFTIYSFHSFCVQIKSFVHPKWILLRERRPESCDDFMSQLHRGVCVCVDQLVQKDSCSNLYLIRMLDAQVQCLILRSVTRKVVRKVGGQW